MERRFCAVRFQWKRPVIGHEWENGRLRPKDKHPEVEDVSEFLMKTPGLFRVFARIDTDDAGDSKMPSGIRDFAYDYGDILALPGQEYPTVGTWCSAIQQMRRAVGLWDRVKNSNVKGAARRRTQHELQLLIQHAITDTKLPSDTSIAFTPQFEIAFQPVNLLAFMWLTLARLASGEIVEQPCMGKSKECRGYIYTGIGPGLKKTGTVTCSPACRKWKERHNEGIKVAHNKAHA